MKNETTLSRRAFLSRALSLGLMATGATAVLAACDKGDKKDDKKADKKADKKVAKKGPLKCDDVTGLSDADKATRTNNKYVEKSATPGKKCDGCQLYKVGAAGACGTCTLVKGPINPAGTCNVWVKKA